jgi:hypothetical protein
MPNVVHEWRGVTAEICWTPRDGRYTAAGIRGYTIAKTPGGLSLRATVLLSDAYKLAQRPLTLVLPVRLGKPPKQRDHEYRYPITTFTLRDSVLDATLGPRITEPYAALPFRRPDPRSPILLIGR